MTANERRMALLEVLCLRRHDTRENLAFEFGVSKRTIEYDVQIYVMEGFQLHKKHFTDKQLKYLEEFALTSTGENRQIVMSILKDFSKRKELCH